MKQLTIIACLLMAGIVNARTERVTIQGDHGKLVADLQTPDVMPKKCPIVILCHGFTGNRNGGLEVGIARELEAKGIASIRFDFNGHGESEGDFQQMTIPNEIEDARHVYDWIKADGRFGDIGITGHSQGGVVVAMLAGQLGRKAFKGGVVLLAPSDRTVPYTYGLRFHQQWKGSEWHLLDHYDHGFGPHPEEAVKLAVTFFLKTFAAAPHRADK